MKMMKIRIKYKSGRIEFQIIQSTEISLTGTKIHISNTAVKCHQIEDIRALLKTPIKLWCKQTKPMIDSEEPECHINNNFSSNPISLTT